MSNFYLHQYDCVFIHIPKTGGLSIRRGFFDKQYMGPWFGRIPKRHRHCFSFCFVRNPYDRLISAWKMLTRDWQKLPQLTLHEFLNIVTDENIPFRSGNTVKKYHESVRHHTIPQTHPFNCLHLSKYVGRYENLEADFKIVCSKINCEFKPLPIINQSQFDNNYMQYFDRDTLKIVNKYYLKDFQELNYDLIQEMT